MNFWCFSLSFFILFCLFEEDISPVESTKVTTRLVVNKYDYGKIIGKGGQSITLLRSQTNASIKGISDTESDVETRMVCFLLVYGECFQAFDLYLCKLTYFFDRWLSVDRCHM